MQHAATVQHTIDLLHCDHTRGNEYGEFAPLEPGEADTSGHALPESILPPCSKYSAVSQQMVELIEAPPKDVCEFTLSKHPSAIPI